MHRCYAFLTIALISAFSAVGLAAPKAGTDRDTEIVNSINALADDFNRGDAKSLAERWTADAEITGIDGKRVIGRDAIAAAFRDLFEAHPKSKIQLRMLSTRFPTDNVALVDLVAEMTPAIAASGEQPTPSMVLIKTDGHWLIAKMHETLNKPSSGRSPLESLKWMVGNWTGEAGEGLSISSSCDWTARGTYLIRKFSAEAKNGPLRAGTEVIGWDPRRNEIRSWTFNADGGFGESSWAHDGDRWIVKYSGTQVDGVCVSSTHIVTVVNAETLTIESKDRVVDGQMQPDMPAVTIKRRAVESKPAIPTQPPKHVLP
jgi:uncharacterized protein (TIGR02246 family)